MEYLFCFVRCLFQSPAKWSKDKMLRSELISHLRMSQIKLKLKG